MIRSVLVEHHGISLYPTGWQINIFKYWGSLVTVFYTKLLKALFALISFPLSDFRVTNLCFIHNELKVSRQWKSGGGMNMTAMIVWQFD